MKYFNPSYWFKLWVLSAPLFNSENQGIYAKSIDNNQKIKDWASKNITSVELNSTKNHQTHLDIKPWSSNLNPVEFEAIPHKHRNEKSRNIVKRSLNNKKNEIDYSFWAGGKFYCEFTPEFWEEIIKDYYINSECSNDYYIANHFSDRFKDKIYFMYNNNNFELDWRVSWNDIEKIGFQTHLSFSSINNNFKDSSKKNRIKINFDKDNQEVWEIYTYIGSEVDSNDQNSYPNKYLDNLQRDFPDWNKDINIYLGVIMDNNNNNIIGALKQKYPNFNANNISIVKKTDYSHFSSTYSMKLFSIITKDYSYGELKPIFNYITQTKINELNNFIANDSKVIQWLEHINDYNQNLPTKIEILKTYTESQKWNAKNTEKEIIKGYIRDWNYISNLIEHDWKLEELNKNVQGLKDSFENLKNEINELDKRVKDLQNISKCNGIGLATSGVGTVISVAGTVGTSVPVIGNIINGVATIGRGVCSIAAV
ncbi:hypothetical protein [Spiroplasma endosymbiont of Panzeria rudis]|uniref:hypothetical protein n=1 Tax=Spiroplasma endosymbiont of Panzeria rudis TaxID=3066301 RepID=UPI0030D30414